MALYFPSSSSSAPFEPLDTVLQRLSLSAIVPSALLNFRLRCSQLLLVIPAQIHVDNIYEFYCRKLAKYAPQIWVVHMPMNDIESVWYTCVLIRLTSRDHRFETKNKTFFEYCGSPPFVIPISGRQSESWNGITEYLNISRKTSSTGPPAFYKVDLTEDWQDGAHDWLGGHGGQVASAPVLNLHSSEQLDEMINFYKYMLYNYPRDTLVFPMGIPGKIELKKQLKMEAQQGWTGRFVIVLMPYESYHYPEVWPLAAQRLQALRDGALTKRQPPAAILILSVQAITNAGLNIKGVGVVDLDKAPDPSKVKDWEDSLNLAREIFPDSVVKPEAQKGRFTLMFKKWVEGPAPTDHISPFPCSSESKYEDLPLPKDRHMCRSDCSLGVRKSRIGNEIMGECHDCFLKRSSMAC